MTPEELWIRYKQEYPESPNTYTAWSFGDSAEMTNALLELVLSGCKTATSCNYTLAQQQGEELPEVGQMNIVLDGHGEAKGIIRTTHIEVVPFHKVTERFARLEGEGDLSLQHWQKEHEVFFTREWMEAGGTFSPDMLVFCEVFQLVYGED